MPDLATLAPVVITSLTPYEGHMEDVIREFAALAQSVWENEDFTRCERTTTSLITCSHGRLTRYRCYYLLYLEDAPGGFLVMSLRYTPIVRVSKIMPAETWQVSDLPTVVRQILISIVPVDTFSPISKRGVCLVVDRWRHLRVELPDKSNPAFEKRGLMA